MQEAITDYEITEAMQEALKKSEAAESIKAEIIDAQKPLVLVLKDLANALAPLFEALIEMTKQVKEGPKL